MRALDVIDTVPMFTCGWAYVRVLLCFARCSGSALLAYRAGRTGRTPHMGTGIHLQPINKIYIRIIHGYHLQLYSLQNQDEPHFVYAV